MPKDSWKAFEGDFNALSDNEIEQEVSIAQNKIEEAEEWLEAVSSWKAAGKPRKLDSLGTAQLRHSN